MSETTHQPTPDIIIAAESLRKERSLGSFFASTYQKAGAIAFATTRLGRLREDDPREEALLKAKTFPRIGSDSPEFFQFLDLARVRERVARDIIKETLAGEHNLALPQPLTATEKSCCYSKL